MPKSWQEEVQEILDDSGRRPAHQSRTALRPSGGTGSFLEKLGHWTRRRFSTTGEMLVTAAVLVVLALFLSIFLRQLASIVVIGGAMVFASALVRGIYGRRSGRSGTGRGTGPVLWRGRAIETPRKRGSFIERMRTVLRRLRTR